jgi:hypothetical protein
MHALALRLAFQVLFYGGSWVSRKTYTPFLTSLRQRTSWNITYDSGDQLRADTNEKFLLVGHSLGGSQAAMDATRFPEKVAGLVLLNSHFNERCKMPYPGMSAAAISVPTLVVLGGKDERLPINRALDDLYVKLSRNYANVNYVVQPDLGHFPDDNCTVECIADFASGDRKKLQRWTGALEKRFQTPVERLSTGVFVTSRPAGVIDALLEMTLPRCIWQKLHWYYFLTSTPRGFLHYMFEDDHHVLWKGSPSDLDNLEATLSTWARRELTLDVLTLPSIHVSVLWWLGACLYPFYRQGKLILPVVVFPIDQNRTYFKIPHPHRIFSILPQKDLLKLE